MIEHVGEEDSPLPGLVLIESDSTYIYKEGKFTKIGINSIDYRLITWFIYTQNLKKNHACGSTRKGMGAYEVKVFEEKGCSCYILKSYPKTLDFVSNLIRESIEFGMDNDYINILREIQVRLQ